MVTGEGRSDRSCSEKEESHTQEHTANFTRDLWLSLLSNGETFCITRAAALFSRVTSFWVSTPSCFKIGFGRSVVTRAP